MTVKVNIKNRAPKKEKPLIQPIKGAIPKKESIIIRALKIMILDIRMKLHPTKTKEQLETYSNFSQLAYGRK
jgi:hypothetical protein